MVASWHFHVLKEFCGVSNFLAILQQSSRFVLVLQTILQYFQEDPWIPIRVFVDAFNDLRKKIFLPGTFIVVDESMSSWKGKTLYFNKASDEDVSRVFGLPHTTKIIRKPKGVGLEIRNACCSETGIMLQLELQEGKEAMKKKEFSAEYGSGTASVLRLTRPWHGKGHVGVGDSAFASFKTAKAMKQRGTYFEGLVKTAHTKFPKSFLHAHPYGARGSHKTLQAVDADGDRFIAVGWKDKTVKTFISTCGTTIPADRPAIKKKSRLELADGVPTHYTVEVPRPMIAQEYFDAANGIDIHNHYRQGSLALEESFKTQTWWHRSFSTLLGMTATDAFLAFRYFHPSKYEVSEISFKQFVDGLAKQLVENTVSCPVALHVRSSRHQQPVPAPAEDGLLCQRPLHEHPSYASSTARRIQLHCTQCKSKCSHYCLGCWSTSHNIVAVCSAVGKRAACWSAHKFQSH